MCSSTATETLSATAKISTQVRRSRGSTRSAAWVGGKYSAPTCRASAARVPTKSSGLAKGLLANSECRSERQLPTWTIWKTTIVVRAIVRASSSEAPAARSTRKRKRVPAAITTPTSAVRSQSSEEITPSRRGRGAWRRTSSSPGSKASAMSWAPLVTRLSQSSWAGRKGSGNPKRRLTSTASTSAAPEETRKKVVLRTLTKATRPSSTAAKIVAKSSSVTTMSAASLATSVPERPIAAPMSAAFSAGASLTPSPVTATTSPRARSASTIRSLPRGEMRA